MIDGDTFYFDLTKKNVISTGWIQKAAEQKNKRLTIALACSILLVYDKMTKELIMRSCLN